VIFHNVFETKVGLLSGGKIVFRVCESVVQKQIVNIN
jgi:hypothetical protein